MRQSTVREENSRPIIGSVWQKTITQEEQRTVTKIKVLATSHLFNKSNLWPNSRTDSFWRSVNRKGTQSEISGGSEVQTVYYASRPYPTYLELPPWSSSTYSWCFICARRSIWKSCSLNKVKRVRMTARAGFACFEQLGWRCPWRTAQRYGQGAWVTSLETSNNNNKNKKRIVWS